MTQDGWGESGGSGKPKQRGTKLEKTRRQRESKCQDRCARRDTEKDGFVNAELSDVTEAHGNFRLFVGSFRQ